MDYRDILGFPKKSKEKKEVIPKAKKPSVYSKLKEQFGPLNEWNDTSFRDKPRRWGGAFNGDSGLTEFEKKGGKDNVNERMGFSEEEYVKRIAGHYQTGIILQKMAQQMDKENRTDTEHKVLHMSLGKYLKMLKSNFKL